MREENVGRIGSMFFGLFLFFFGLPFTMMPFFFYQLNREGLASNTFESIFFYAVSIPFMMFGLFTQSVGLRMMRGTMEWWEGSSESPDPNLWDH